MYKSPKRKKLIGFFVIMIIFVLLFSVIGVVVTFLSPPQSQIDSLSQEQIAELLSGASVSVNSGANLTGVTVNQVPVGN